MQFLESIGNFIQGIGEAIKAAIDFLIGFIEDIFSVVEMCGKAVASIPDMIGWMPTTVIGLLIGAFSIVVIYKILGREG